MKYGTKHSLSSLYSPLNEVFDSLGSLFVFNGDSLRHIFVFNRIKQACKAKQSNSINFYFAEQNTLLAYRT